MFSENGAPGAKIDCTFPVGILRAGRSHNETAAMLPMKISPMNAIAPLAFGHIAICLRGQASRGIDESHRQRRS